MKQTKLSASTLAILNATLPGRRHTVWAQSVAKCNAWKVTSARPDLAKREAAKWGRHASLRFAPEAFSGYHRRANRSKAMLRALARAYTLAVEREFPDGEAS